MGELLQDIVNVLGWMVLSTSQTLWFIIGCLLAPVLQLRSSNRKKGSREKERVITLAKLFTANASFSSHQFAGRHYTALARHSFPHSTSSARHPSPHSTSSARHFTTTTRLAHTSRSRSRSTTRLLWAVLALCSMTAVSALPDTVEIDSSSTFMPQMEFQLPDEYLPQSFAPLTGTSPLSIAAAKTRRPPSKGHPLADSAPTDLDICEHGGRDRMAVISRATKVPGRNIGPSTHSQTNVSLRNHTEGPVHSSYVCAPPSLARKFPVKCGYTEGSAVAKQSFN
jgi:hypothetical protein